jgi:glycosyltransferase involved in cell wall biosynthesis
LRSLHLGKYYPPAPGGIESHVRTLAQAQADLGHDVHVICVNHLDRNSADVTHSRWISTRYSLEEDGAVKLERIGRLLGISRLEICPLLPKKLKAATSHADVVHLHAPNPLMLVNWWLVGDRDVPLVVTHHSDVVKQRFLNLAVAPFESRVYSLARKILSDSPNYIQGSRVLQRFNDKVEVLPLGINLEPFLKPTGDVAAKVAELRELHGSPLWLMVGRMTYYKGHEIAVKALGKTDGKLVIVGNGPLESKLKCLAARLGVIDRTIWLSSVSHSLLTSLYHAATALWFPSVARSEGFGLVQVEAMASGCPVINTRIPGSGVDWVSQNNISGLTVAINDPDDLANAANKIVQSKNLRESLSAGARARAISEFDARKMGAKSICFYANC